MCVKQSLPLTTGDLSASKGDGAVNAAFSGKKEEPTFRVALCPVACAASPLPGRAANLPVGRAGGQLELGNESAMY